MSTLFDRLQIDLDGSGLDALIVLASSAYDPDLAPFSRGARIGQCFLVAPAGRSAALGYLSPMERDEAASTGLDLLHPEALGVARLALEGHGEEEIFSRIVLRGLEQCGVAPGAVGIAGSTHNGSVLATCRALEEEGWRPESGHAVVRALRKAKTPGEVASIAHSADAVAEAFRWVAKTLGESEPAASGELQAGGTTLTPSRLKAGIAQIFGRYELGQPEGGIVAPAEEGAVPHNSGSAERALRVGESLVVDLFPKGRMFADCTRTFCVGDPPDELARAHEAVLETLKWSQRAALPGVSSWELQEGACERLGDRGYETPISDPGTVKGYVHGLGHGVGYELHELPSFRRSDRDRSVGRLTEGDVIALEPGLYNEEAGFGVRLEDLVFLGSAGPVNLTPLPYDLDPVAWSA